MALIDDYSAFLTSFQSAKFKTLRPARKHILDKYGTFEAAEDVAIELPTGAGKTLIALLIAEAKRKNGSRIAVLSANKTLARLRVRGFSKDRVFGIDSTQLDFGGNCYRYRLLILFFAVFEVFFLETFLLAFFGAFFLDFLLAVLFPGVLFVVALFFVAFFFAAGFFFGALFFFTVDFFLPGWLPFPSPASAALANQVVVGLSKNMSLRLLLNVPGLK